MSGLVDKDKKINLIYLAKNIWKERRKFLLISGVFVAIGFFVAVTSPRLYTAKSVFIPQTSESGKTGGSLGGLASLAGINLNDLGASSEISPALYPQFISSLKFKKKLANTKVTIPGGNEAISYSDYYLKVYEPGILELVSKYTLGLPTEIIKALRSIPPVIEGLGEGEEEQFVQISYEEFELFNRIDQQLSVVRMEKEGVVQLTFVMPDPLMAAQMAQAAETLLQEEIISYKIQNANEQLKFTEERFSEKKAEFELVQSKLANFKDRNQNIISASLLNQQDKLEAEYNFSFSIYTELAKQLEQAKLQVSKDTPVFSVIQKVSIPIQKSSPNRPLILVGFCLAGVVVSLLYLSGIWILRHIKEDWQNIE